MVIRSLSLLAVMFVATTMPVKYAQAWGAFADCGTEPTKNFCMSANQASKAEAIAKMTINKFGAVNCPKSCKLVFTYKNECVVQATAGNSSHVYKGVFTAKGATFSAAENLVIMKCKKSGYKDCTYIRGECDTWSGN